MSRLRFHIASLILVSCCACFAREDAGAQSRTLESLRCKNKNDIPQKLILLDAERNPYFILPVPAKATVTVPYLRLAGVHLFVLSGDYGFRATGKLHCHFKWSV